MNNTIEKQSVEPFYKQSPAVTFYCPKCKNTSVADRDKRGDCICPHCALLNSHGGCDE